jgi:hypothetical protein
MWWSPKESGGHGCHRMGSCTHGVVDDCASRTRFRHAEAHAHR